MNAPIVASPCTGVCRIDADSGWCVGCLRSIDEIVAWASSDDRDKRRVLALLPQRRQRLADDRWQVAAGNGEPS